jgi:transposase
MVMPTSTRASRKRKLADTDLLPAEQLNTNPTKRREANVGQMIQFLEHLREARHDKPKAEKLKKPWNPKLRHFYNMDLKAYVVFLRYGQISEPGPNWHTCKRISEIAGLKQATAFSIVKHWRLNGYQIVNLKLGQRPRAKWQTPEIINYLTKPKTLVEWAHLSLHQRVILIEQKFGVKISITTLATVYKKNKVSYIKPQYVYCRKLQKKDEIAEQ